MKIKSKISSHTYPSYEAYFKGVEMKMIRYKNTVTAKTRLAFLTGTAEMWLRILKRATFPVFHLSANRIN